MGGMPFFFIFFYGSCCMMGGNLLMRNLGANGVLKNIISLFVFWFYMPSFSLIGDYSQSTSEVEQGLTHCFFMMLRHSAECSDLFYMSLYDWLMLLRLARLDLSSNAILYTRADYSRLDSQPHTWTPALVRYIIYLLLFILVFILIITYTYEGRSGSDVEYIIKSSFVFI